MTVIERTPVRYFVFQNIGLDFISTRVASDDRTSSHAVNFALDAFWEVSFDLLVSPVKSPTRRDDYADVSVTDCFAEQGYLAKVVGNFGVSGMQDSVEVEKQGWTCVRL